MKELQKVLRSENFWNFQMRGAVLRSTESSISEMSYSRHFSWSFSWMLILPAWGGLSPSSSGAEIAGNLPDQRSAPGASPDVQSTRLPAFPERNQREPWILQHRLPIPDRIHVDPGSIERNAVSVSRLPASGRMPSCSVGIPPAANRRRKSVPREISSCKDRNFRKY